MFDRPGIVAERLDDRQPISILRVRSDRNITHAPNGRREIKQRGRQRTGMRRRVPGNLEGRTAASDRGRRRLNDFSRRNLCESRRAV
jgi:hypothetical protein